MADENSAPEDRVETPDHAPMRRSRRTAAIPTTVASPARAPRRGRGSEVAKATAAPRRRRTRKRSGPLRSLVIVSMVAGLIATVALPAYGAWRPEAQAMTLQQVAADDAQTLVVASDATAATLSRDSYSATTPEEIEKKKAEEAAAERARLLAEQEAAAAAAAAANAAESTGYSVDLSSIAPGDGDVRFPLPGMNFIGQGFGARGGAHMGVDILADGGVPIYAAAAGVVRVSQESYYGYGVAVTIDHVLGGQQVNTLYAHMTYGSRMVESGQYVEAGQMIGLVGSTGSSTANHLHFEVQINGSHVDPMAWLQSYGAI